MKISNTLTGKKENFTVANGEVKMYVCGITPYSASHLGHAMCAIYFDTIRRYLEYVNFKVRFIQNFTDIDDKIIARANEMKISTHELAQRYTDEYFQDMDALNIKRATAYPRATGEIPKIIEVVTGLIKKGHAYESNGDVYFRVTSFADYGKLSHRTLDGMRAGARVEVGVQKEHPMDFALWKTSKPDEPSWDSPWGKGRPGWHIECTAMSLGYLGETIDIHGGGQDLVFPHHENELAQSEAFSGKQPFVRYWLHNGLMQAADGKMSKSLGNVFSIRDALAKYSADALRIFILSSHYRSPLMISEQSLTSSERGAERLRATAIREDTGSKPGTIDIAGYRQKFKDAMDDDFNTPQAIAVAFDISRDINREAEQGNKIADAQKLLKEITGVLGLTHKEKAGAGQESTKYIDLLVDTRNELRVAKQFALADKIRVKLDELGVIIEDKAQGSTWKLKG